MDRIRGAGRAATAKVLCYRTGRNPDSKFNFSSLAMRSSPQVGLSPAISRINHWRFFGKGAVLAIWISSARKGETLGDANGQECQV
jgi:hypothetical protein